ncbi:TonB-dependent receptor [Horticoccus sp. 23ND18S-11]|uniref:TonB-dependent receptor n=1 Tax=Horticoccus sp. 23ND18S-11 TaxID=3391832 RepID=UPI0039C9ACB9
MTSLPLTFRVVRRLIGVLVLLPLLTGLLNAQPATGTVSGRVFDQATGRSLQGAVVRIAGTNASDFTDAEGRYLISAVRPGPARVEIEYVGLEAATQSVMVAAGSAATVDVGLKSSGVHQMASFEVKEAVRGQALAINQQKTAAGIVNIVSEETFGTMNSGNIGYALQRLPGISVNEDQDGSPSSFNLRGVPGDYNSLQIDGNRIPNASGTSRAANTKFLVADGITNIEVMKAVTPDRDGDAIGGIVNIISRTAFQREGRDVKLVGSGSYNAASNKWGYNGRLSYSDIFSIAGREKNLGVSVTLTKYTTDRYSENSDIDWERVTPSLFPALNLPASTKFLEASHSERSFRTTHTTGINASIDYRTDAHTSFYFRPGWSHYDQNSQTYETDWDVDKRFQDVAGGRKTYAFLSPDGSRGGGTPGPNGSQASLGYIGTDDNSHNDLWTWAAGGRHELSAALLTYDLYYSTSTFVRPNFTEFNIVNIPAAQGYYVMEYDATNRLRPQFSITNGLSPTDFAYSRQGATNLIFIPRSKEEEIYSARTDLEKKFQGEKLSHTLKVGAKYRSSKPKYDQNTWSYQVPANSPQALAFPFEQVVTPASGQVLGTPRYQYADQAKARALFNARPELFTLQQPTSFQGSNNADYTAKEETTAAYVMDTLKFGRHTIIGGLRWEQNEFSRNNTKAIIRLPGPVLTTERRSSGSKYDTWLPGIHFRHELAKNLILRESFNQSYGRPSLGDISRGRNESVAVNGVITITDGNPALKPFFSDNYDVQLEYYTEKGGLYSISLFQKNLKDYIYSSVTRWNVLDANEQPVQVANGTNTYTQSRNGPEAKNKGVELIARQRLYFLPGPLKGLSADVSATFTRSRVTLPGREQDNIPLQGFSKYLLSTSLSYAWGRFTCRADYRYRDAYIEGLDADTDSDEWFSAREQVDAEMTFRIRKDLNFFASGTNLTHRPQVSYTGSKEFPEDVSYSGRKYTFGLEYRF